MQKQPSRLGWSTGEEALLFTTIEAGRAENRPLKAVFEQVAGATGRKPNSVRNYYYTRVKQQDLAGGTPHMGAFVPFTEAEVHLLLRTVLSAQASGISVRACTLSMGDDDNRAMLRYQNKYRSLLKTQPALVRAVAVELEAEGLHFDPYASVRPSRAGRPRRNEAAAGVAGDTARTLEQIEGFNAPAFLQGLDTLAGAALRGVEAARQLQAQALCGDPIVLRDALNALRERVRVKDAELTAQQERFHTLLAMYRRLVGVNREFLGMSGILGMSSLSGYISDLKHSVADCEQVLGEYNA
ncbi:MAG: hypothetical protein LBN26_09880 [Christensenellaceae bacterium]|jgi:hypothetical protein|nr:hypothetical protein [Christensenellaceae bacterium]